MTEQEQPAPKCRVSSCPVSCRRRRELADLTDRQTIRAAALRFIERFGGRAGLEAKLRSDELEGVGDLQGQVRWRLIQQAIDGMLGPAEAQPFAHASKRMPTLH